MANLLETIRKNSNLMQQPAGVTDESNKLATLLRAKQGKAGTDPEVAQSNIAEQAAVAATNAQLQSQVAPQAQLQLAQVDQGIRGVEQQRAIQSQELEQTRRGNELENRIKTDELLQQAEQARGTLDFEKDRASAEQIASNLRLQNKQYTDNLQREGARARLNDGLSFREQLLKTSLSDNEALARDGKLAQSMLNDSDREFDKKLAQIGVDDAWSTLRAEIRQSKTEGTYSGISGIVSAGIQAAGAASGSSANQEYAKQSAAPAPRK